MKTDQFKIRISPLKKKAFARYAEVKKKTQSQIIEAYMDKCIESLNKIKA